MNKSQHAYQEIVELIYRGLYEVASIQIRSLREKNTFIWNAEWSLMQNLLAARIALKSGLIPNNISSLESSIETPPFLSGEIHLLKGLVNYQANQINEGLKHYREAKRFFIKSENKDKELLCTYNILIGETHVEKKTLHEFLQDFRLLEIEAEQFKKFRILGLVFRQKSYLYKENNKWNAALHEAKKSIQFLELHGAASDYQLSLINLCEILFELEQNQEAKKFYEMIIAPYDKRVLFPKAYIELRLFGPPMKEESRDQSCPHFLQRYILWQEKQTLNSQLQLQPENALNNLTPEISLILKHDTEKLYIQWNKQNLSFKKQGLEAKLIEILSQGPQSKSLICEKLWPAYSELHHLDNRLHRLISRINKRIEGFILYSSKSYKLVRNPDYPIYS